MGSNPDNDVCVYEEKDDTFYTSVYKTKSTDYIIIFLSQTTSNEVRLLNANTPEESFEVFLPREKNHEYNFINKFHIITLVNLQF